MITASEIDFEGNMGNRGWILVALALLLPSRAWAEGGEVVVEPRAGMEFNGWSYTGARAWGLTPSFGVTARYGVMDSLQLGVGVRYAWANGVAFDGITLEGKSGRLYSNVSAWTLPLSASYLLSRGADFEGLFSGYGGLVRTSASDQALVDPTRKDASGLVQQYSVTLSSRAAWGWVAGVEAALQFRPLDWLGGVLALYAERRTGVNGGADYAFGLVVRPMVVRQVGPSW